MRTQIQLAVGAAEIEAAFGNQQPFGVLALMTALLLAPALDLHHASLRMSGRRAILSASERLPEERLTTVDAAGRRNRGRNADSGGERVQLRRWIFAGRHHDVDFAQQGWRKLRRIDANDQRRFEALWHGGIRGRPIRWKQMMRLLEGQPVRPARLRAQRLKP